MNSRRACGFSHFSHCCAKLTAVCPAGAGRC